MLAGRDSRAHRIPTSLVWNRRVPPPAPSRAPAVHHERPIWYRSFYWRVALSFIALVVIVLVGQSAVFSYLLTRPNGAFAPGDPNAAATAIAARVAAALDAPGAPPLDRLIRDAWPDARQRVHVVLRDGREAGNGAAPLNPAVRAQVAAAMDGREPDADPRLGPSGPVVTAPIQVNGVLRGLVVLPPPPPRGAFSEVGRLLSFPGTLLLLGAAAVAGALVFAPLRRRLRALEGVAGRLGGGDFTVRADETGGDEIAGLGAAFNRMSGELSARAEALKESDRMRRQMLADISHELRTPLTAMRGFLDTLAMPEVAVDEATRARYLETARQEAGRLERLVEDLLDLARHEQGGAAIEPRVFAVERVFAHVLRRHERDVQAAGITCTTRIADDADQMVGDPGRLEQVVGNLVANALRHTPAGGTIHLEASATHGGWLIAVVDSGAGIPAAHLPHVFDRFYKGDSARTGHGGGSGLGLSIVKAIVERHGGTIAVESRPGRTAFLIDLPRGTPARGAGQSSPSANL